MKKYNKRIQKMITDLIRSDYYTVAEICTNVGISERCFYYWQNSIAEFADAIKGAKKQQTERMVVEATRSLFRLIQGFYVDNYKTIYENSNKLDPDGKPIKTPKEWTVYHKYYPPKLAAIIFVLCNMDPEIWKNTFRHEITGKGGKDLIPARILSKAEWSKLTDDELKQLDYLLDKVEPKSDVPGLKRLSDKNGEIKLAEIEEKSEKVSSASIAK
jgi:hypothetical protein